MRTIASKFFPGFQLSRARCRRVAVRCATPRTDPESLLPTKENNDFR